MNNITAINLALNELLVEIPAGGIELRDDRKKENWAVSIASFFLAKVPVTQDLYFQVMNDRPSTFAGGHRPVETVSWLDAVCFCNKLSEMTNFTPCYLI